MANEKRLIDANALLASKWCDSMKNDFDRARAKIIVQSCPTVDAVEVVHGRWEQMEFWPDGGTWRCSECGRQIMFMKDTPVTMEMHYCPNCGAKMDGDVNA